MSTESPLVIHTGNLLSNLDQETQARVLELRYMKSPLVEATTPFAKMIQKELEKVSYFDMELSCFIRTKLTRGKGNLGKMGGLNNRGYRVVGIKNFRFLQSHLVCLWFTGKFPKTGQEMDHINGNQERDCPSNLRVVPKELNDKNLKMFKNNKSGYTGVRNANSKNKPYQSYIIVNKKFINFGNFSTREEAAAARNNWLQSHSEYGFTARHGT